MDSDGNIWISPGGIDKGTLSPQDIVKVCPDGKIEGIHTPSSELPFHKSVYELRPDVKAVLHAPSARPGRVQHRGADSGHKPFTDDTRDLRRKSASRLNEIPGSDELGNAVARVFEQGANATLLENHGTVTVGTNLLEAFIRFETLDYLRPASRSNPKRSEPRSRSIKKPLAKLTASDQNCRNSFRPSIVRANASSVLRWLNLSIGPMISVSHSVLAHPLPPKSKIIHS